MLLCEAREKESNVRQGLQISIVVCVCRYLSMFLFSSSCDYSIVSHDMASRI